MRTYSILYMHTGTFHDNLDKLQSSHTILSSHYLPSIGRPDVPAPCDSNLSSRTNSSVKRGTNLYSKAHGGFHGQYLTGTMPFLSVGGEEDEGEIVLPVGKEVFESSPGMSGSGSQDPPHLGTINEKGSEQELALILLAG